MVEECNAAVSRWFSRWLIHVKLNRGTLGFVYDPYRRFSCHWMLRKKKRKIDESNRDWREGTNVGVSSRPWTLRFRVVPLEIHASPVAATAVRWRTLAKLFRNMYKVIVNTRHARYTWSHYTQENDTEHVAPVAVVLLFCSVCLEWRRKRRSGHISRNFHLCQNEPFASRLSREYRYFALLVIRLCDTLENVRMKQGFEVENKIAGWEEKREWSERETKQLGTRIPYTRTHTFRDHTLTTTNHWIR